MTGNEADGDIPGSAQGSLNPDSADIAAPGRDEVQNGGWYAVFVLAFVLMTNYLDRGIIHLLVDPIREDLQLTDTEISLVMGFAFVIIYLFMGLPIARLVDSKSRRLILGGAIGFWSVMTIMCGLAQTHWQLLLARMGVGAGEACNGPAAYSILSDYFPKDKLPRALAILQLGYSWGQGLTLIIGGAIFAWILNMPPLDIPILGELRPWQVTFIIAGVPGLILAPLMATVREPKRRGRIRTEDGQALVTVPIRDVGAFFHANGATYYPLFTAMGLKAMLFFGYASWIPTFYARTYGWSLAKIGLVQGCVMLFAVPIGLFLGSALAEYWARKGRADANLRVVALAAWGSLPLAILFPLMPTAWGAVGVGALFYLVTMMSASPVNAALQVITPNQMRGQITALFLLVFNLLGAGLGATIVALFTDYVYGDPAMLRYAMVTVVAIFGPIVGVIYLYCLKPYGRSVIKARDWD